MHKLLINIRKEQRGTTLLEVIVSIAILGVILVPLANLFSNSLLSTMRAREQLQINQLASSKLEEIKSASLGTFEIGTVQYEEIGEYRISTLVSKVDVANEDPYKIGLSNNENIKDNNDFIIEIDTTNNEAYIKYEVGTQHESISITSSMFTIPRYEWFIQYMYKNEYTNKHQVDVGYFNNSTKKICASFNVNEDKLTSQFKIIVNGILEDNICFNYKVYNFMKKPLKAIVVGSKTDLYNTVKTQCMEGTTTVYYNMSKDNSFAWIYNVKVTVSKQSQQLVELNGTKKGR
jgi:prepilin-type N-terminal cleavage/methylation domain-containing protein